MDRFSIGAAVASGVSLFLVVSYARLFVGWEFALREMGIAQVLYLVLFSRASFWAGFTGLAITIGAICTPLVTGRTNWRAGWLRIPARTKRLNVKRFDRKRVEWNESTPR